jgi:hypothetical protein
MLSNHNDNKYYINIGSNIKFQGHQFILLRAKKKKTVCFIFFMTGVVGFYFAAIFEWNNPMFEVLNVSKAHNIPCKLLVHYLNQIGVQYDSSQVDSYWVDSSQDWFDGKYARLTADWFHHGLIDRWKLHTHFFCVGFYTQNFCMRYFTQSFVEYRLHKNWLNLKKCWTQSLC